MPLPSVCRSGMVRYSPGPRGAPRAKVCVGVAGPLLLAFPIPRNIGAINHANGVAGQAAIVILIHHALQLRPILDTGAIAVFRIGRDPDKTTRQQPCAVHLEVSPAIRPAPC